MQTKQVIIFGVGAAGSGFLTNFICVHPELSYSIVDFDVVEQRNIVPGTQPYTKADVNRPKVQAIQRIIRASREKTIEAHNFKIMNHKDILKYIGQKEESLIIDAFDNAPSRNLFLGVKGYNVLHIGFSAGLTGEAVWDGVFTEMKESKSDKSIDVCELHLAKPFISCLTSLATMVASRFVETGEKKNVYFDSHLKMFTF